MDMLKHVLVLVVVVLSGCLCVSRNADTSGVVYRLSIEEAVPFDELIRSAVSASGHDVAVLSCTRSDLRLAGEYEFLDTEGLVRQVAESIGLEVGTSNGILLVWPAAADGVTYVDDYVPASRPPSFWLAPEQGAEPVTPYDFMLRVMHRSHLAWVVDDVSSALAAKASYRIAWRLHGHRTVPLDTGLLFLSRVIESKIRLTEEGMVLVGEVDEGKLRRRTEAQ